MTTATATVPPPANSPLYTVGWFAKTQNKKPFFFGGGFVSLQTSLLCIVVELAGEGSLTVTIGVTGDR